MSARVYFDPRKYPLKSEGLREQLLFASARSATFPMRALRKMRLEEYDTMA
jgi:hypothetical protein